MKRVCVNHPDTKATVLCAFCSKPICFHCIVERNAHFYCSEECAGNAGKAALEQAKADAQNYGIEFSEDYTVLKHFPSNCKLTSYQIPACVTAIGDGAFSGCEELSSITLPAGVTTIGDSAFSDCKNLSSITLPDGVTAIGNDAFFFCVNLKRITLPAAIRAIHPDAFYCAGCEDYVKQNYGHLMKE